jgi:carbonic anhydrase/acetyltransferase-like protein (isoleucine patch superfamily)
MEHALLRGRTDHPVRVGDAVLIGPHTHLNGTTVEDEVFVATGVSMSPGSVAGTGAELRINSVLHVNSRLAAGTTVPIGWIAAGDPAQLFSPDRHDDLWAVQEPMDFPGTVAELYAEVHPDPRLETPSMREFRLAWEEMLSKNPKLLELSPSSGSRAP